MLLMRVEKVMALFHCPRDTLRTRIFPHLTEWAGIQVNEASHDRQLPHQISRCI